LREHKANKKLSMADYSLKFKLKTRNRIN